MPTEGQVRRYRPAEYPKWAAEDFPGQPGSPHTLGGSTHDADTLANLNSKISDADVPAAVGFTTITVGVTAPGNPAVGDLWVDTA